MAERRSRVYAQNTIDYAVSKGETGDHWMLRNPVLDHDIIAGVVRKTGELTITEGIYKGNVTGANLGWRMGIRPAIWVTY
jgi:hypothetical protein